MPSEPTLNAYCNVCGDTTIHEVLEDGTGECRCFVCDNVQTLIVA